MLTVGAIASRSGGAYLARHGAAILPSHRRALHDLAACRTAALGGHVSGCDHCGYEHFTYHSCRNRSCPQCHTAATAAWSVAREAELLPIPYFHVVFTLPAELRDLVRAHQHVALAVLMSTAAESLQALAADDHYVGGRLGILAVLHTWTRSLVYHPHVHCLVPGGGLAADGQTWVAAREHFLVPVRAPSVHFRARFLTRLKAQLPDVVIPARVWQTPWVVYCKPAVQGSGAVLRYLARYVHRVAITNAGLVALGNDQVTFRYRDRRDSSAGAWRTMTLSADEFLRRFLQHVLPRGFHKVRYYGIWHPAAAPLRARLTLALAPTARAAPCAPPERAMAAAATTGPVPAAVPLARPCPRCTQGDCFGSAGSSHARRGSARVRGRHDQHHWGGPPLHILRVRRISAGGAPRPRAPERLERLQDATAHATPGSGRFIVHGATFDSAPPDTDTLPITNVGLRETSIVPRATRFSSTKFLWRLRAAKTLCRWAATTFGYFH